MKKLALILALACTRLDAAPPLNEWVAANVPPAERVLCQRETNGEYFFVARAGDEDQLRLGSRVDLTGYAPDTLSVSVSWRLRDENDLSIVPRIRPTPVRDDFRRIDGKAHAESVQVQTVNAGRPKRLRAGVAIEKCPVRPCSSADYGAQRYTVEVCEIPL